MDQDNKHKFSELVTQYEFEPTIYDLFVEGYRDKAFWEWHLIKTSDYNLNIIDIDSVELPEFLECKLELDLSSNKNKVIVLAHELEIKVKGCSQYKCIVDKDFDEFLGIDHRRFNLYYTDYSSLDLYTFNKITIEKFIQMAIIKLPYTIDFMLNQFINVLTEVFFIRLANIVLQLNLKWLDFIRCCTFINGEIFFDNQEFLKRYLSKNAKLSMFNVFEKKMNDMEQKKTNEPRNQIYKDDLFELFEFYLLICTNKHQIVKSKNLENSLFCSLTREILDNENLFQNIKNWLENG